MNAVVARLAGFLGLKRNVGILLAAIALIAVGEEMWFRFLPKYLEVLGASVFLIGLYDAIKTLLGAVYAYPGGLLADRWGHRRALLAFTALSIAGYLVLLLSDRPGAVIAALFFVLAWTGLSLPATFSLVGASLPAGKHAMGIGVQSLIRRIPVLIGPLVGGFLMDRLGIVPGVRVGVVVSAVLASAAILLQMNLRDTGQALDPGRPSLVDLWNSSNPALRRLLLSDILIRFCERIPFAWIVIYAMNDLGMSASQVGLLLAIEMGAAIACYIPASHLADRYGREPFVIVTFVFFTIFPLTLLAASSFPWLAVAFAVRGLKEFGEPARKALIISYSPPACRGQVIGAYYLVRDVLVTGGAFLGAALWSRGAAVNFWTAAFIGMVGTAVYVVTLPESRAQKITS